MKLGLHCFALLGVPGIARQYWRAWIETPTTKWRRPPETSIARQYWRAWIETSAHVVGCVKLQGIARQYWRAWIETISAAIRKYGADAHRPPVLAGVD